MINNDRIVPIQKIDRLSLLGETLTIASVSYGILQPTDVLGDFEVTGSGDAGTKLANQPVKSLDIKTGVTAATVYFVPGFDFEGLKVAGAAPTFNSSYLDNDDVVPDGISLYKAVLSSGTVTLTLVTPVLA